MKCLQLTDFRVDIRDQISRHVKGFYFGDPLVPVIYGNSEYRYRESFIEQFHFVFAPLKVIDVEEKKSIEWFVNREIESTGFYYALFLNEDASYDGVFRRKHSIRKEIVAEDVNTLACYIMRLMD